MDLAQARQFERQGDLAAAEKVYRQLLQCQPEEVQLLRSLALNLWQQKRLPQATEFLQQATQLAADDAELCSLLGVLLASQGQIPAAIETLRRGVALDPNRAGDHYNLGNLYSQSGAYAEAVACFRQAVELQPDFAEAHFNLGNQLRRRQDLAAAIGSYERALAIRPGYGKALTNLTRTLVQLGERYTHQGQFAEAREVLERATQLAPDSAEAWGQLGLARAAREEHLAAIDAYRRAIALQPDFTAVHVNLGVSCRRLNALSRAESSFRLALSLDPQSSAAHCNLGEVLLANGRLSEGLEHCVSARRINPEFIEAHVNEAIALAQLARDSEAENCYRGILKRSPDNPVVHHNLAVLYCKRAMWSQAEEHVRLALSARPNYAEAHYTLATLKLSAGDWLTGWAEYEWRWKCPEFTGPLTDAGSAPLSRPADVAATSRGSSAEQPPRLWDGSPLDQSTILLRAEQGLGDTLQFMRFARCLKRPEVTVWLACQPPLRQLLSASPLADNLGIDQLLTTEETPPSFDFYAPLMSLPHRLGISLEQLPLAINYLAANRQLTARWRQALAAYTGFRIGIVWQANVENQRLKSKSFLLHELAPLAQLPQVHLVSLQKHEGSEQLSTVRDQFSVVDLGADFDETAGPFMDTAAVVSNLDLVVCCDSAVGHLAGALGIETWVALPQAADWRWLRDRADSPWYPRHRLFWQTAPGDWSSVFQQMGHALQQRFARMGVDA